MASVPNGVETLPKISIAWVGRTNVTDRQTTDGWTMTYSERELEFTFAKNSCICMKAKAKARDSYIARLTGKPDQTWFTIIGSGSWLAKANGAAVLMRPSIARANEQLDPRQQLANTPPPQSTTPGLHPISIHQCWVLLFADSVSQHWSPLVGKYVCNMWSASWRVGRGESRTSEIIHVGCRQHQQH